MKSKYKEVYEHIKFLMLQIPKEPTKGIPFPYLSVTSDESIYGENIYCWDNFHMALRYAYSGEPKYMKFLVDNLLFYQKRNGFVPNCINIHKGDISSDRKFHAQPFLMQAAFVYASMSKDYSWVNKTFRKLTKYLEYYEKNNMAKNGLFFWRETYMSGLDNDIESTFFKPRTILTPDISTRIYMEYNAAAKLAKFITDKPMILKFQEKSSSLKKAINRLTWDNKLKSYAGININSGEKIFSYHDELLNKTGIGLFSFFSFANFLPLFAKIASRESAIKMISEYLLEPCHFYSIHGIRSLSKSSEYYNNAEWGNPPRFGNMNRLTNSNWQGPIWIMNCYLAINILINYGLKTEGIELCDRTLRLLEKSLSKIGTFTENFNSETGEPLYVKNFASWNILVDIMEYEIENPSKRLLSQFMN